MMDFANYTLGTLVPHRRNYDFTDRRYQIVRANILWRIYDLGFSQKTFGEIDKAIVNSKHILSRHEDNVTRIDRYGKKYSWIAYYELHGHRMDKGHLKDSWWHDEPRSSEIDIDPSFPSQPHEIKTITEDFLGDRGASLNNWIQLRDIPDITSYLLMHVVDKESGPWVLLDGHVNQREKPIYRDCFFFLRSFMISKTHLNNFITLKKNTKHRRLITPGIPEDHYTFAGEVPWCETFRENGNTNMEFRIDEKIKKVNKFEEYKEPLIKKVTVLIPVCQNDWESYHNGVNLGQHSVVPAKELASTLFLNIALPSWDLYDSNWKRASITTRFGQPWGTSHNLTYLRKDLLDKYLKTKKLALFWELWGERRAYFYMDQKPKDIDIEVSYRKFSQVYIYENSKILDIEGRIAVD